MKIEINNVKLFSSFFDSINSLIATDLIIIFKQDKMVIHQLNATRTGLVIFHVGKEFFEGYQVEDEEIVSVDISDLIGALKMFKTFKKFILETDLNKAKLRLIAREGKKSKRTSISLLENYELEMEEVGGSWNAIIKLQASEFKRAMKDCADVFSKDEGDVFLFNTPTTFTLIGEGIKMINEDTWTIGDDMEALISENTRSIYPCPILKDIADKGSALSKTVTLHLQSNAPIKIVYDFKGGVAEYYVVPVIDPKYDEE